MMTAENFNLLASGCSIVSLLFGLWAFFTQIKKSLDRLLDRHLSYLSMHQALDIVDVYLCAVQSELREYNGNFIRTTLPQLIAAQSKNFDEAKAFVFTTGDKTISSHRLKLTRFYLIDRSSFDHFLTSVSPLNAGNIKDTKDKVYNVFADAINGAISAEVAGTRAGMIMAEGQTEAAAKIREAIVHLYESRGDTQL